MKTDYSAIHWAVNLAAKAQQVVQQYDQNFMSDTLKDLRDYAENFKDAYLEERTYVARDSRAQCFGTGPTVARAIANCKAEGGTLLSMKFFSCPAGAYVGPMGGISYPGMAKDLGAEEPFEVNKYGERLANLQV